MENLKELLDALYLECEHGDAEHRQWLKAKFDDFSSRNVLTEIDFKARIEKLINLQERSAVRLQGLFWRGKSRR